jgi:hypothetical protein
LKGHITNTSIGVVFHKALKNEHHIRYGVSATWIDDFEIARVKRGNTKLRYDDFGLSGSLSYELVPNWDIEARHTATMVEEKELFNLRRFSVGIVHRFTPK